ncbi:phosphoribosylanthranilate isomerase [Halobacteriaceae bacterium SHR40]|uniref:phosphoribosylanthranilate isomerase n=1 Tax=Halovenus amylolytica TaxID=2500550 RepID=UPI000FE3FF6E
MSSTRVKICGITSAEDRDCAVQAGADAVGFISQVPVDSPREITPEQVSELVAGVPPFVTSVLVTMPDTVEAAVDLGEQTRADAIQIHGTLTPEEIEELQERISIPVIVAVDIDEEAIEAYADAASALLVDSTDADGGGGTGRTHDWGRSRELHESIDSPLILAGGLTPENVAEAVGTVEPFAVDTASGVEQSGGVKDHDAVEQFTRRAQRAVKTV